MRRYAAFLLSLACLALVSRLPAQQSKTLVVRPKTGTLAGQTAYTNSYALIIGVGNYAFLPKDKRLDFAAKDATDLRDVLVRSYGFATENVTVLLDDKATRANIEAALSALADDKVKPDDRVLIYFSGHGQTVKLQDGGEMGFLIPFDARVDLAHPENRGGYLQTCLRMDSLWGYLEASAAKHRLLIADACFGGLLVRGKALNGEKPNRAVIASLLARPALQAMTAGGSNEEALEDSKLGHSAYTYKLLEELKAQAATPDTVFLASELAASLKTSVSNLTNSKQTPQFGNYRGTEGEFLFISTDPQAVLSSHPRLDALQLKIPPAAPGRPAGLLTRPYKVGDMAEYELAMAMNNEGHSINTLVSYSSVVKTVRANGEAVIENSRFAVEMTQDGVRVGEKHAVSGRTLEMWDGRNVMQAVRVEGTKTDAEKQILNLVNFMPLATAILSEKPAEMGDVWEGRFKDFTPNPGSPIPYKVTFLGSSRIGNTPTRVFKQSMTQRDDDGKEQVVESTIWQSIATGRTVKAEFTLPGVKIAEDQPPVKMQIRLRQKSAGE